MWKVQDSTSYSIMIMYHRRKLAIELMKTAQNAKSQEQLEAVKSLILPWEAPTFTGDKYCEAIMRNHPMIGEKIKIDRV